MEIGEDFARRVAIRSHPSSGIDICSEHSVATDTQSFDDRRSFATATARGRVKPHEADMVELEPLRLKYCRHFDAAIARRKSSRWQIALLMVALEEFSYRLRIDSLLLATSHDFEHQVEICDRLDPLGTSLEKLSPPKRADRLIKNFGGWNCPEFSPRGPNDRKRDPQSNQVWFCDRREDFRVDPLKRIIKQESTKGAHSRHRMIADANGWMLQDTEPCDLVGRIEQCLK